MANKAETPPCPSRIHGKRQVVVTLTSGARVQVCAYCNVQLSVVERPAKRVA